MVIPPLRHYGDEHETATTNIGMMMICVLENNPEAEVNYKRGKREIEKDKTPKYGGFQNGITLE